MISVESISQSAPYVKIPNRGFVLRFLIWTVEKVMGKKLLPARVLLWFPKTLISSGILEALAATIDINVIILIFNGKAIATAS